MKKENERGRVGWKNDDAYGSFLIKRARMEEREEEREEMNRDEEEKRSKG